MNSCWGWERNMSVCRWVNFQLPTLLSGIELACQRLEASIGSAVIKDWQEEACGEKHWTADPEDKKPDGPSWGAPRRAAGGGYNALPSSAQCELVPVSSHKQIQSNAQCANPTLLSSLWWAKLAAGPKYAHEIIIIQFVSDSQSDTALWTPKVML